jgi:CTP:molybdopterin cytidylyltransferase MocA
MSSPAPPFAAVVLAAGRSRRAGVCKPAHRHRGRSLLRHAIDGLAVCCRPIVVVVGHHRDTVGSLLGGLPHVIVVDNDDPDRGMFSSVRTGLAAVGAGARGVFVLPADCPLVSAGTHAELAAAFLDHGGERPVVPRHAGRGGHPVLLPGSAREMILAAAGDATLRDVIRELGPVFLPVDDAAVLMDLDTAADLRALDAPPAG